MKQTLFVGALLLLLSGIIISCKRNTTLDELETGSSNTLIGKTVTVSALLKHMSEYPIQDKK